MNVYVTRDKTTGGEEIEARLRLTGRLVNFNPDLVLFWSQRPKKITHLVGVDIGYAGRKQKGRVLDSPWFVACVDVMDELVALTGDPLEPGDIRIIEFAEVKLKKISTRRATPGSAKP